MILDSGETALVVEFGRTVDPALNDRVLALDRALTACNLAGVRELVPTYRSLMIHYDPLQIARADLVAAVERALAAAPAATAAAEAQLWTVPCCYDPNLAEDIAEVAQKIGATIARVAELHRSATYRVYMYGFAPGFCYLGGLPAELAIARRATPRPPLPTNSVIVGGGLCVISTVAMPSGWWQIGRTPERMFAPAREPAFLFNVGDSVQFEAVEAARFAELDARAAAGEIVARRERRS